MQNTLAFFLYLYLQLIRITSKISVSSRSFAHAQNFLACNSVVFLCWHCYCAFTPLIFKHFKSDINRLNILLSTHRDARLLEVIASLFGATKIIHYDKRNGISAVKRIKKALQNRENLVLAPDGPRGPKGYMNNGVGKLLNLVHGVSFVPISVKCSNYITLNTWDRMIIPLPFSKIEIIVGTDLVIQTQETMEEIRTKITDAMRDSEQN